ncbi:LysM peptidoglycan-binding domain-containing protein [Ureibacillus sp. MALMAid1270]|uniref:LysM peptidoglycan-binding domain-containing protein n=1 Tax=Ureibacillus sp. MALMAid1270 TaxID=3411629 RepID=UPI003BA79BFD
MSFIFLANRIIIVAENNIKKPNLIYPGDQLRIVKNDSNQSSLSSTHKTYIVKPGDPLWKIAKNYGTTVDKLVKVNNIKNRNFIYPGDQIKIYLFELIRRRVVLNGFNK